MMAKTKKDLSAQAHLDGDADGRGPIRAAFYAFSVEIVAALLYGLVIFIMHPVHR